MVIPVLRPVCFSCPSQKHIIIIEHRKLPRFTPHPQFPVFFILTGKGGKIMLKKLLSAIREIILALVDQLLRRYYTVG